MTIAASLLCALPATAADVTLHWSEIGPSVKGVQATVVLTNDKRVKGVIADVQADSLVVDPNRVVPRATVAQIRIRRNRIKGRVIGGSIGIGIGLLGLLEPDAPPGARATGFLIWSVGGLLIGYATDRHEIVINIAPEVAKADATLSGQLHPSPEIE